MEAHAIHQEKALDFITAGKALFTLRSVKTQKHFTFKVTAPADKNKETTNILFVKVLTGQDNESSYSYIGFVKKVNGQWNFFYGDKSRIGQDALSVVAFTYVFNHLSVHKQINGLEIWHEGKCCRCGRTLTHPESIISGIGPECANIKENFNLKNTNHVSL